MSTHKKLITFIILLFPCLSFAAPDVLHKVTINNAEAQQAVCMDGSPAVYYIAQQNQQKNWLIMLGGGSPCGTLKHCERTLETKVNMTSSKARWNSIKGKGLLSSDPSQNPMFAQWNKVFVPQCSMDVWIGNEAASKATRGLNFQGGSIVHALIQELKKTGLKKANKLLFIGNSAGGIGVMNHIDWVASQLPNTKVKGLTDGSWILDTQPFPSREETHKNIMDRFSTIKSLWVDEQCAAAFPQDNWKCMMGQHVYSHIQSPLLVRISQNDLVHLKRLGINSKSADDSEKLYIKQHEQQVCESLQGVKLYFSLSNTPHTVVHNKRVFSLSHKQQSFYSMIGDFVQENTSAQSITSCLPSTNPNNLQTESADSSIRSCLHW